MSELSRPPAYVNWSRLNLLVIGFIAVLYGVLHFVARETLGTPNLAWSAFIGLLAGLGIGIPVLIKQRRIAQDGTDQHLGDAAVRSSASWIGLGVGLGLALISSLYPDSVWFQLDPPPEPIVRLVETPLALGGTLGERVVGESVQGVRYRYVCARPDCTWEMVGPASPAPAAGIESCRSPVAAPQLLPFAPRPVLSSYAGVVCREGYSASFVVMAAQDGSIWLWRSDSDSGLSDIRLLLRVVEAVNGLLAGLFAGLFLYGLKGSRLLPVHLCASLARSSEPISALSVRTLWGTPFVRLARLSAIVFGSPGIVVLLLASLVGIPNGLAELVNSILVAVLFGGVIAIVAQVVLKITSEIRPGIVFVRSDLIAICALLGLWVGVIAAFAMNELPLTGWSKLEPSPAPFVKLTSDPDFVSVPDGVCGVTREGVRYARICEGDVCAWLPPDAIPASRSIPVRCGLENYFYEVSRRPLFPLPPGPVVLERSGPFIGAEAGRRTFFVILADGSVWWLRRGSSGSDRIGWGISVVWGLITGIIVGIAAARMRRDDVVGVDSVDKIDKVDSVVKVDKVDNVVRVENPIDLTKPYPPDQTLST